MALTPAKEQFAAIVAQRTGLSVPTVRAWVQSEGGRDDNPLNIRRSDGGFGGFGTWQAAATATVKLLGADHYAPIRRVAQHPASTVRDELQAIVESPWAEGHYRNGKLLFGAYAALYPTSSSAIPVDLLIPGGPAIPFPGPDLHVLPGPIPLVPDALLDRVPDVAGAADDAVRGVLGWVADKAAIAFLYLVLTVAAAALIVMGLLRATGTNPARARSAVGARLRPAPDDIPF